MAHYPPLFVNDTRPVKVEPSGDGQSTPEKSASIARVSAFPTLNRLPLQPRGEAYVPCVLIRAGGWFDGVIALVTVVDIGSQACCD